MGRRFQNPARIQDLSIVVGIGQRIWNVLCYSAALLR